MNPIETITEATFDAAVLKSGQPVLVVFGTSWSRPCQALDPILEELARDWAGRVKVLKANADHSLDLSLFYQIQSVPTLLYFVEGNLRLRIVGTATKEAILAKLNAAGRANTMEALVSDAKPASSGGGLG